MNSIDWKIMRIVLKMSVYPEFKDEYEKRHNPIWEELKQTLLDHGVRSYTIFYDDETNDTFAYAEVDSEEQWNRIAQTEVCQRWWKYMAPLMPTNEDSSPVGKPLREIFHIEA